MVTDGRFHHLLKLQRTLDRCPRCGKRNMVVDAIDGELLCGDCGYVLQEKIEETGPEWRAFSQEERDLKSRTGMPTSLTMHDKGLATMMAAGGRDASGRPLPSASRAGIERLRTWDRRSQVHEPIDRNLRQALSELDRTADKLNLSEPVVERAAYIYRKALGRGLVRGRSISGIMTASVYAACRDTETPRTLKDAAKASALKKKEIARCYRLLLREMDLRMPIADPARRISRIASKAGASEKAKRRALQVLKEAEQTGVSAGKDPTGLAAAALYAACVLEGEPVTQKDVAEGAGVTEVTIRNRYKGLRDLILRQPSYGPFRAVLHDTPAKSLIWPTVGRSGTT